jgi:predicted nuclease of predicted toxin-antitoxin system
VKFLIDEQLSPAVGRWLTRHGHEAEHVYAVGLMAMPDAEVARRAVQTGAVIVTKDEDYLSFRVDVGPVQVLWLRVGNVSNRILFQRLEEVWPDVARRLESGESIVTVWPAETGS